MEHMDGWSLDQILKEAKAIIEEIQSQHDCLRGLAYLKGKKKNKSERVGYIEYIVILNPPPDPGGERRDW